MNTIEFKKLLALCLVRKMIIITLEASPQNKRGMYKFKGFRKLNTNPYVGFKRMRNFRRIPLNYDYEDWEKTKPDVYDDLLTKTNELSTTTATTITRTSAMPIPPTMPNVYENGSIEMPVDYTESLPEYIEDTTTDTIPTTSITNISTTVETTSTITIEDNITNTSTSVNDTHITLPTTQQGAVSEAETTLETKPLDTGPSPLGLDTTTPILPEITTTSILSPGTTITTSVHETNTSLTTSSNMSSEVTTMSSETKGADIKTPVSTFVADIKNVKNKLNSGYFTASLAVILREIADKDADHLQLLMAGFHEQVMSMVTNNQLAFLDYPAVAMISMVSTDVSRQHPETVRGVAKDGVYLVENRHTYFSSDTNTIMDLVDTVYVEEDARNIANILDHLKRFPDTDKSAEDISRDGLDALIFIPWGRILGDPRERLLRMEIAAAINKRTPAGALKRRRQYDEDNQQLNDMSSTTEMSTINETTHEYQYLKNATIVRRLKKKMRSYRISMTSIRYSEWKLKTRRGPTTTTTTTTGKPTMHKSKYYRMKKSKRLYRMKPITKKITTFKWRYYGKVRKLKKVQYRKFNNKDAKSTCDKKSHITKSNPCSSDENNDFDKTIDNDSDSYYPETDASYEESNIKEESNSHESLISREKNGDAYKSNADSKIKDDNNNNERFNVKRYKSNSEIKERYISSNSFESHKKEHDKYMKREKINDRKYKSDFKGIDPKYKPKEYSVDEYNFNRNNKFLSRMKFSKRPYQMRHPISIKNYKRFTESNINIDDINDDENNAKNKRLNVKKHDRSQINNGFYESSEIGNYYQKLISRNTKDKYNKRYITLKEHKSKVSNKLGKTKSNKFTYKLFQIDSTDSDSIDDERLLKANIKEAMFHRDNVDEIMDRRRNLEVKVNKFQVTDSVSDDEVKLKGKIYKAFGFSDNFGKRLRTIHQYNNN